MGGVLSSLGQTDAAYNPWELGYTVNPSVSLSHWPGAMPESNYNFVSALVPYRKLGTFNLSYLNYGTGSETVEELDGTTRSIKLEDDKLFTLGYGRAITQKLFVGISLKSLTSTLAADYKATAMLMDFGLVYHTLNDKNSVGVAIVNYGSGLKYYQTQESVPTEYKVGYTRKTRPWANQKIVWGLSYAQSQVSKSYSLGAEYFPGIPFVSLRAGLNRGDEATKSMAGLGVNYNSFDLDFGYDLTSSKMESDQTPLRFALTWSFGARDAYSIGEKYMASGMKNKAVALWEDIKPREPMYAQAQDAIHQYANPPQLLASAVLEDDNGDGILSPGEAGNIVVTLSNNGRGRALMPRTTIEPANKIVALANVDADTYYGSAQEIEPGQSVTFKMLVKAHEESEQFNLAFNIVTKEARNFNPEPVIFTLPLKGFSPPQLALARYTFREDNSGNSAGNGNGIIEKGEQVELTGYIVNAGLTEAREVKFEAVSGDPKLELLSQSKAEIGVLKPGESRKVLLAFKLDSDYAGPAQLPITFKISESRPRFSKEQPVQLVLGGFYKDTIEPVFKDFDTAAALANTPALKGPISDTRAAEVIKLIADAPPVLEFDKTLLADGDSNGNGVYEPGETLRMKVGIRNTGGKTARGVTVTMEGDETIKTLLEDRRVGDIEPGSYQPVVLEARIPEGIPRKEFSFNIKVTESSGFNARKIEEARVAFQPNEIKVIKQLASLMPVPNASSKREKSGAIVVGIGAYGASIGPLKYAARDAELAAKYLNGVLGIPDGNIKVILDDKATKSRIEAEVGQMAEKGLDFIALYYSGHGVPDPDNPRTGDPYIVPFDADLEMGSRMLIRLNEVVSALEHKTKDVLVLLDACFSGNVESAPKMYVMAQKGLGIAPKFAQEKAVVMTASSSTQPSLEFDKAGHGYFSYYFMLGLKGEADKNSDGAVTDTELCEYVKSAMAGDETLNGRQTPECSNATGQVLGRYR
ncbi:MAG: caspase family protein [Elusimicrobiota bacterium]